LIAINPASENSGIRTPGTSRSILRLGSEALQPRAGSGLLSKGCPLQSVALTYTDVGLLYTFRQSINPKNKRLKLFKVFALDRIFAVLAAIGERWRGSCVIFSKHIFVRNRILPHFSLKDTTAI
jgi:hypothetical protein